MKRENSENQKPGFDNIDFSKLDIGGLIDLCLRCNTKEDAEKVLRQYEKYCDTPGIAHANLGYIFGYGSPENIKKLYSLFPVNHPFFGKSFGRGQKISDDEIIEIGQKMGEDIKKMQKRNDN